MFVQKNQGILPDEIGSVLEPIRVPVFPIPSSGFDPSYATILSWLSFVGGVLSVFVLVIFLFRFVTLSAQMITKGDSEENVKNVIKKVRYNFLGLIFSILVPFILSLVGALLGVGNIFEWPKMFSSCESSGDYEFYFQAALREGADADKICFGG
ncbi:hypothetical protein D6810_01540 [Candidatus Dojkabacteria bacterium]|uniref:Uncharacterized protein n=1 Tax=Candidatus Dojkabacteria bacterium TaxID=2099670 RepID=A0A3M0YZS1_9BACT|nr:MAG: hypothetical protein D6810_01540 [Candidatus Dojkabacteria bacterium]